MRHNVLAAAILSTFPCAYAADESTLQTINIRAERASNIDSVVTVENTRAQNGTLGGMLEHVSGVQKIGRAHV